MKAAPIKSPEEGSVLLAVFHDADDRCACVQLRSDALKGRKVTLPFYAESNKPAEISDLSAFFTDQLTGKETYGAGRYVDVNQFGRFPPAAVTIDFNFTYNPNCARSPYFTCPVAIDSIPTAVAAGERDPHAAH